MITRICKVCNRSVPLDGLRKSERSLYGRAPHCLECYRAKRRQQWNNPALKFENRLIVSPEFTISTLERFSHLIIRNDETGCWDWQGHISKWGYGGFSHKSKTYRAHRFIYQIAFGKLPDGLEVDHLCRNRKCVNIHHLEAVTHSENIRRGKSGILRSQLNRCNKGHDLSVKENCYTWIRSNGTAGRQCKICSDVRNSNRVRKVFA